MLKQIILAIAFTVLLPVTYSQAQEASRIEAVKPERLIGTWDVSLYFSEDAPPSGTTLIISKIEGAALMGSFYSSDFSESGVTVFKDEILFTAVTADGTGPYLHSGRLSLEEDMIQGQTLSTGRDFLMAWTAVRQTEETE